MKAIAELRITARVRSGLETLNDGYLLRCRGGDDVFMTDTVSASASVSRAVSFIFQHLVTESELQPVYYLFSRIVLSL